MHDSDDRLAWTVLARTPGLDAAATTALIDLMGGPGAVLGASPTEHRRAGTPAAARDFLAAGGGVAHDAERRWLEGAHHHLVPCTDASYPALLRAQRDCPLALYVTGNIGALAEPQLAIVGSRNPTAQGRDTAFDWAEALSQRGLSITSGLAEGIDAAAHRGALRGQGTTVAVLGTGIDRIYPVSHRDLSAQIAAHGALVSEFPLGTPPRRGNFPQRNRIIAGLCLGTLVVEAARRSGSLITARLAGNYGREVFAVPGSVYNPLSRGCHELIKAGAILAESADDILSELNFSAFFAEDFPAPATARCRAPHAPGMDKDHKILLDALGFEPVDLDALVVRTGFKPDAVSSMMLILELEGHVQAAPGGRYSRVAHRRAGGER